ncbi:MAG: metallophosphoesterase, partial [Planctomycetota bacterium]
FFAHLIAIVAVLFGHTALFIYVVNRLHSTALPRRLLKLLDFCWSAFGLFVPCAIAVRWLQVAVAPQPLLPGGVWGTLAWAYVGISIFCGISAVFHRIQYVLAERRSGLVLTNHTAVIDLEQQTDDPLAGSRWTQWLASLPGNEVFELSVHEKQLGIRNLPQALEGLTITHLSDLHMTGQLRRPFYDAVVAQANALGSDLIAITGDIVEKRDCLPWIDETLGQLNARHGVFYVVGNHELRIRDIDLVRRTMAAAGLQSVGDRWISLEIRNHPIVIAGNELPWFRPAADMRACPSEIAGQRPFRILLSHSPDQLDWAVEREFDLMLAGHTHGGQVRLPLLGPLLAPSWNGVSHASGVFRVEPTLMHVSRGLAGTRPLRLNCRPELAQLTLRSV